MLETSLSKCVEVPLSSIQFWSHWQPCSMDVYLTLCKALVYSPVPVQFDWDKIRTEMKPVKMARKEVQHAQKKSPKKKIRSNWRYFELIFFIIIDLGVYFPWLFTF